MKLSLLCLFTWGLSFATTLGANTDWNTGYVTLPDGRKLDGQLNYNWKAEVLQLKMADGTLKAFSAARLNSFTYFDGASNQLRKFVALTIPGSDNEQRPVIMEECTVGRLSVYRRLRHSHELIKVTRPSLYGQDKELVKDYDNFTYLVLDAERAVDLAYFSNALWPRMTHEFAQQLTEYIKVRQLDLSATVARLIIINQYNYLAIKAEQAVGPHETDFFTDTTTPAEIAPSSNSTQR